MNEQKIHYPQEEPRPVLITLICVVGVLYTLAALGILLFEPRIHLYLIRDYGKHFPYISMLINSFMLIAYIGIWRMKRWGVFLYFLLYVAGAVLMHASGGMPTWEYVPGFIILLVCAIYTKQMS